MATVELKASINPRSFKKHENKHKTYNDTIKRYFDVFNPFGGTGMQRYQATGRAIQALLGDALKKNVRVRALGGDWSFSRIASGDGWLLNTKPLNLLFAFSGADVSTDYPGERQHLRFAQCGVSIKELDDRLAADGLSMFTHGASNGQTIAGALSTGTHGSAVDVGGIAENVVGLHLLLGPERSAWIERKSVPVVTENFLAKIGVTEVHRDDDLFNAALIGIGSFGFIHGVALQTRPLFLIEFSTRFMGLTDPLKHVIETHRFEDLLPERPYHFEILINPFASTDPCLIRTGFERPFGPHTPPLADVDGSGLGDDALAFVGLLTDNLPGQITGVIGQLFAKLLQKNETAARTGTVGEIWTNTNTRGRACSTAISIPAERAVDALQLMLDLLAQEGPLALVPAMRFVKGGAATLGWTRFPLTCILEADGPLSKRNLAFYALFWQALLDADIPHAFHWGKLFPEDASHIERCYGSARDTWRAARQQLLPDPAIRQLFSSDLLDRLGLSG